MNEIKTKQAATPVANDWGSRSHIHTLVMMAVTIVGIYFCYRLTAAFFPALTLALALAVLFAPLHRWLVSKVRHPGFAATICVLTVALLVVVPAIFVAERIIGEAARGAESIKAMVDSGEWRRAFEAHPRIAHVGHWIERQFDLPELVSTASSWLTATAASFVRGSLLQLFGFAMTFYVLFYFLRDRDGALESLRSLSPLSASEMNRLFGDVVDTVHATFYGTFVVSMVQGTLGGLMFWWLGLPAPLLWGIVMGLTGIVPVVGAFVVWIPAAIFLVLEGSGGKALLLALWGAIVVGGIDNVLYPMLVGKRMKMHTLIAFISVMGGLVVFGPAGLILGPVIFAATRLLLETWSTRSANADA